MMQTFPLDRAFPLDQAIEQAVANLKERGIPLPHVCMLLGTGLGSLPAMGKLVTRLPLYELPAVPTMWHEAEWVVVQHGSLTLWLLEDAPQTAAFASLGSLAPPAWHRGYPVWLAAALGAKILVHTSACVSLDPSAPVGSVCATTDHINLSGGTPLLGLGASKLGPLFPDQTRLHHRGLVLCARKRAQEVGCDLVEGIAACLAGPSLNTPAEIAWLQTTPAHCGIQDSAGPWIACAHAGLALLALSAVCDDGTRAVRVPELIERMDRAAGPLEDLLKALLPDLEQVVSELEVEL